MLWPRRTLSVLAGLLVVLQVPPVPADRGTGPAPAETADVETAQVPDLDTIVVDARHPLAADINPGTAIAPLATIGRALTLAETRNQLGIGSRIVVGPGTYRETVRLRSGGQTTQAPLLIEGSGRGVTTVSGSEVWTGWDRQGDTLVRAWPHRWGLTPLPSGWQDYWNERDISPVVQRREQIFADGHQLRQVLTRDELQATPGSFLIDEGAGTVTVRMPAGVDPGQATLEVGTRTHLFRSSGWNNVTVRGITFQHAVNPIQQHAVVIENSRNVVVEQSEVLWGNWTGLGVIWSENVTVRDTRMNNNGAVGFIVYQSRDLLFERSENSYNNWRGAWGNYRNWEDGSKVWGVRGMVVRNHTAVHNYSFGLWFDYDNEDVVIENSFLAHNALTGLFLEASQGPFTVRGNVICDNVRWGVMDGKSSHVTLAGNHIFGNGQTQLIHTGRAGARGVTAWDTGERLQVHSEDWTLRDNVITGAGSSQQLVWVNSDAADWSILRATRTSADNVFHNPAAAAVFRLSGGTTTDFGGWRQSTGQDATSQFAAPTQPLPCEPASMSATPPVADAPEAPALVPGAPDPAQWAAAEQRLVDRLNSDRRAQGAPALSVDSELVRVARGWSGAMAQQASLFANPSLATQVQRDWRELAQSIGSQTRAGASEIELADLLHDALMASAAQQANALRPDFNWVGAGVHVTDAGTMWVTVNFMRTDEGAEPPSQPASPTPSPTPGLPGPTPSPSATPSPPPVAPPPQPGQFRDVTSGPHIAAVEAIARRGVTEGCGGDLFCPNQQVTRGQMASFLKRALELPDAAADQFGDDNGSTHEAAVNALAAAGVTGGCGEGRFCPQEPVTRAQMASFLQRAFELAPVEGQRFTDVGASPHVAAINAIAGAGITLGCAEGRYCPQESVRRGEMASFLGRALGLV